MELFSVFITGANRGIGLEFVRQIVQLPKPPKYVFATYRSRDGIQDLKKLRDSSKKTQILLIKMDVTRRSEIECAKKIVCDMVGDKGLTLLINNAGVNADQSFPQITEENLLYHFKTNTIGPIMVLQELLPLLENAALANGSGPQMRVNRAAVLNISSVYTSSFYNNPSDTEFPLRCSGYCISKASLNMAMRTIAATVKSKAVLIFLMHPGWVKTDMGSSKADLEVGESVSAILDTLPKLTEKHHGALILRNGNPIEF